MIKFNFGGYNTMDDSRDLSGILPQSLTIAQIVPVFRFAVREDLKDTGDLFLPARATDRSVGWDVKAAFKDRKEIVIKDGFYAKIPLGFRVFAPKGWWLELRPRSSTFAKKNLNSLYGVLDNDWHGECIFSCKYDPDCKGLCQDLTVKFGESIGQIIPYKLQEMIVNQISNTEFEELCKTENCQRDTNGFGSTDKGSKSK